MFFHDVYIDVLKIHQSITKHMHSKHILDQAKAFLCWDKFPDLTIKLIPLQEPVAFYYPPFSVDHTIIAFYPVPCEDYTSSLFLLFHEVGHYLQFQEYQQQGKEHEFWEYVNADTGMEKIRFEQDSWERGATILSQYLRNQHITEKNLLLKYRKFAIQCVKTYTR